MGIVNVTPDSFFDGGRFVDPDDAIAHGLALVAEGADVIDVGGESSRPGAAPVDEAEERRRVVPVVAALAPHVRVSIDTAKAGVAEAALEAGATIVNDITASLWPVAAAAGAAWVAMHMLGTPATMQDDPRYDDVVRDVRDHLVARAEQALAGGVDEVWVDPGIGFGKTVAHNLALLGRLDALVATGLPVCVGVSRKGFLGRIAAASDRRAAQGRLRLDAVADPSRGLADEAATIAPAAMEDRLVGSVAVAAWAFSQGARMVRAHDVRPTVHAARLVAA